MRSRTIALAALGVVALASSACSHAVKVPPPRFDAVPAGVKEPVPVTIAVEVQDPPVIGEHLDGLLKVHQYDHEVPDLRARVEEHVAAAAASFGLRPQAGARLRLLAQVHLGVQTRGWLAGGGSSASAAGVATLLDARGTVFTHALDGAVTSGDNEPGVAFEALDQALRAWLAVLGGKLQADPALAMRLQGP